MPLGKGKSPVSLPASFISAQNFAGYLLCLVLPVMRLFQAQKKRMDRIEQVAGIKILAMETAIGTIIGDNGVNCCFRMGKGQAELCVSRG